MSKDVLIEEIVTEIALNEFKRDIVFDFKRRLALQKKVRAHRGRMEASDDQEVRRNATSWGGGKVGKLRRKGFGRK